MILYTEGGYCGNHADKTLLEHDGANVYVRYNPDYTYKKEDEEDDEDNDYGEEEE